MTFSHSRLEKQMFDELGTAPAADFKTWCQQNPDAVASLQNAKSATLSPMESSLEPAGEPRYRFRIYKRNQIMSIFKGVLAASILMAASIAWMYSGGNTLSKTAFADEIPGIDRVRQMSWTVTFFTRVTSKDGKQSWIEKERRLFTYRHPGQYRETMLNPDGDVLAVHISDNNAGRMLDLQMKVKKAVLKSLDRRADPRGPFAWEGDALRSRELPGSLRVKSVSMAGKTQVDGAEVNVARVTTVDGGSNTTSRVDMYFDPATKQLAGIWSANNGADQLSELEKLVGKPRAEWGRMEPIASLTHEIKLRADLSASDFSLVAPDGFTAETVAAPTVTEDEMLEYIKAAVAFNENVLPDSLMVAFDSGKLDSQWELDEVSRSKSANALIEQVNKFRFREIYQSPVERFVNDNTQSDSFQFVGSGSKSGDAKQIIAWYRLKHGKQLRAVFGNLTIREIDDNDLPFVIGK